MSKICPNCGFEIEQDNLNFCEKCGTRLKNDFKPKYRRSVIIAFAIPIILTFLLGEIFNALFSLLIAVLTVKFYVK